MINVILEFIEIHWEAFVKHCLDGGIPENEIEKEIETIKCRFV